MKSWQINLQEEPISSFNEAIPEAVLSWLARLRLLYETPLAYIVPDESLLTPETIRFFITDEHWLDAMEDGALSIGRNSSDDTALDSAVLPAFKAGAAARLHTPRMKRAHKKRRHLFNADSRLEGAPNGGFILRSEIVRYWRGIEVAAKAEGAPLSILRLEAISDEILICILSGIPDTVTFTEPTESLRFGTADNQRRINIRSVTEGKIGQVIQPYDLPSDANGCVDISRAVREIGEVLGEEPDAARFALQMICSAEICEFKKVGAKV